MMYVNAQGQFYQGDMQQGDREATAEEVAAWELSRMPTKEQRVAAILAVQGKDRLLVQTVIIFVESQAPALAAQYGVTLTVALATLYSKNKSYRECKDLEAACRAVEVAP